MKNARIITIQATILSLAVAEEVPVQALAQVQVKTPADIRAHAAAEIPAQTPVEIHAQMPAEDVLKVPAQVATWATNHAPAGWSRRRHAAFLHRESHEPPSLPPWFASQRRHTGSSRRGGRKGGLAEKKLVGGEA
ncbi:hypothetical protein E2562_019438 [Oryza meyeriana var. granulata]|uniref:SMP domain-containing protein n=1 Tax=Oryza meyeriana var. granulata TaxID=110450 RepID=A0A6G1DK55_9ORYZ|nr:hypothetical protein E2562_019438 [Oryza meyeriana var. granulata]